jgi:hypothetical protein
MQNVIMTVDKWSHLIPDGEMRAKINELLPLIVEDRKKMEELVELICNFGRPYGNYAHMRFASFVNTKYEEDSNKYEGNSYKYGRMLDTIANTQCGGGGANPNVYWDWYEKGYFNYYPPAEEYF